MIGKTHVGRGFYGCFRYVMGEDEPEKAAHIIGGNLAGRDARELSSEVRLSRQRRADIEKPVWHIPIAFHPDESLTDAQMQDACHHFLDTFGVNRDHHQYLIVRHHDTAHGHAHIVVNRISDQGKLLDLHRDRPRVKAATRQVEKDLGLRITVEKDELFQADLRATILQTASAHPPLNEFCQQLQEQGITPRFAYRNGGLHGLTYRCNGIEIRGSKLGQEYSFPGLQKYLGVEYQPERDEPVIKAHYVERKGARANDETKGQLRQRLAQTVQPDLSLSEFCQRIAAQGITPQFGLRRGKLSALSYHYQGQRTSGAQLGEAYTFKGLQQELGICYQPERDDPVVKARYTQRKSPEPEQSRAVSVINSEPVLAPHHRDAEREQQTRQHRQRAKQRSWGMDLEL
ncbi:MAG: relaxase/mobilization nuclease domain-containing protein [Cyanobacteria bacterium P01_A01_bin.17]